MIGKMHPTAGDLVDAYWRQYLRARAADQPNAGRDEPGSGIADDEALAWEVSRRARQGEPDAVNLLVAAAGAAPDEGALCFLGAGPLEELVNLHGVRLAKELDDALDREPRLRKAMSCVRVGVEDLDSTTRLTEFFFGTD